MLFPTFAVSALVASVSAAAPAQSLSKVLAGQPSLSNLTTYLSLFPSFESTLTNLTNITLLAPNNDAFATLLNTSSSALSANDTSMIQGLFSYHILNGSFHKFDGISFPQTILMPTNYTNVTAGQAVEADGNNVNASFYSGLLQRASTVGTTLNFTGGVIHIIDSFLTIPPTLSSSATELGLSSMVGALTAAGQVDTVDYLSDVTAFVPNDVAFQSIASTFATLPFANISSIIDYHIVNGSVGYSTMLDNTTLQTMTGLNLRISIVNGSVFVNNAKVLVPNILVANGVVHVIDQVLNPMNISSQVPSANSTMTAGKPAFSGATSAKGSGSGVPFTSGVATPTSIIATPTITATGTNGVAGGATSASHKGAKSTGAAVPAVANPGVIGAAALFGAGAFVMNM